MTVIGSVGFYAIGGDDWSYIDSLYMTIITLPTVGYGEVHFLNHLGKIWSILIIVFGVTGIGAFIRTLNEEFNQLDIFRKKVIMKKILILKNIIESADMVGWVQLLHMNYVIKNLIF